MFGVTKRTLREDYVISENCGRNLISLFENFVRKGKSGLSSFLSTFGILAESQLSRPELKEKKGC